MAKRNIVTESVDVFSDNNSDTTGEGRGKVGEESDEHENLEEVDEFDANSAKKEMTRD